ncbi:MAG: polysaccharide deacetylase family protein [Clostridiaceae bacterium]|nr:polysaccharide deacetylase family protein [Clostridiaceae bacterium]
MKSRKGIFLRSSSAALAISLLLTVFPFASGTGGEKAEGLVTGSPSAAFFDTCSLAEKYGVSFEKQGFASMEDSFKAVYGGIFFKGVKKVILCLDMSEASSEYEPDIPADPSQTENVGSLEVYQNEYGVRFSELEETFRLDRAKSALESVKQIADICSEKNVSLTLVMMPIHTSRWDSINKDDIKSYKKELCKISDYWDFSVSTLSADMRYFYTRDCMRPFTGDMMLEKMTGGKTYLPAGFGSLITRTIVSEAVKKQVDAEYVFNDSNYTRNVPVLMYHHITDNVRSSSEVTPDTFRSHMEALKTAGYTTISAKQMIDFVESGTPLPEKPVLITLDDGYLSNYEIAYPVLKELSMKAVIFTIGASIGKSTYKDTTYPITPHFTYEQAIEMKNSGVIEIQSHTYDMHQSAPYEGTPYARTTALPFEGESEEEYIAALETDFMTYRQKYGFDFYALAYPKGQYNDITEAVFHSLGIKLTVTTYTDRVNTLVRGIPQSLYSLCRYNVPESSADNMLAMIAQ